MGPSKIRRALGHVKDQTSISLAKVGGSTSLSDLDVAIVKATRHEEYPAEERHIREILSLTSYSRAYISACVNTLSRRLNKTKNWTVALKTLMLIQRLLSEGDPAYEQEIFFSTRRGTRILNMSDFRDTSQSNSWDYSAFVRTYALYLDERLEYKMQGRRGRRSVYGHDDDSTGTDQDDQNDNTTPNNNNNNNNNNNKAIVLRPTPVRDMKTELLFSKLQHLQQLLERFLACRPTGSARSNRVVIVALYPVVKESFQIYYDITEILGILIDRFMELDVSESVKVYEIFSRVGKQFDELENLYSWCKSMGIARSSEYPDIERITDKKLELIDELIRDKAALAQGNIVPVEVEEEEVEEPKPIEEPDMNSIKALPAPEDLYEEEEVVVEEEEKKEEDDDSKAIVVQQEVDLLNLGEGAMSAQDHADKLALALFDGLGPAGPAPTVVTPGWEAFKDEADWESALVQSASGLTNQRATLAGGFDTLLLDGLYQQGQTMAAMATPGYAATGSASSVAFGSAGRPAMLALPAPPQSSDGGSVTNNGGGDPFAASLAVAPPSYVQMSDMGKKQRLLVEEQAMWEQYKRDGMQGHMGMTSKVQTYPNYYSQPQGGYGY